MDDVPNKIVDGVEIHLTQQEINDKASQDASNLANEVAQQLVSDAKTALIASDAVALYSTKRGIIYSNSAAWVQRDAQLARIVRGAPGPIPPMPTDENGNIIYPS